MMNPCTIPAPAEDRQPDGRWMNVHNRYLSETKEKEPDVIFLGDSIIQYLQCMEMWNTCFAPMHALNFGIGGDTVQNVLWRVQNGELENVNPKVIVLCVGTNNSEKAEDVADGILEIVKTAREKQPQAYIVVLTLLPRGHYPNSARTRNEEVNSILKEKMVGMPQCELVNVGKGLVQPDGTISHHDMYDYLHPTNKGYLKAFEPLHEILLQLLSENEPEKDLTPSE